MSASDALPARLAAQQLGSLVGMSRKVQEAILCSQEAFERQAEVVERAVLARSFYVGQCSSSAAAACSCCYVWQPAAAVMLPILLLPPSCLQDWHCMRSAVLFRNAACVCCPNCRHGGTHR